MVELTKICDRCKSVIKSDAILCPVCKNDVRTYEQKFISYVIRTFFIFLIAFIIVIILIKKYINYFFAILLFFAVGLGIVASLRK
jgi:hypothetical protein